MSNIIASLLPIFIIIALGYGFARAGFFKAEGVSALGKFVIHIALPALIFKTLAEKRIQEVFVPAYLFGYTVATFICFVVAFFVARACGQNRQGAAINAFGQTYSNSAFVGYPLLLSVIGANAGIYFALNSVIENVLLVPAFLIIAESENTNDEDRFFKRICQMLLNILRKPLIIALICGLLVSIVEWKLPTPINQAVGILAGAAAPLAIFAIGCGLSGIRLQGNIADIVQITVGKLLLLPLMVAFFVWLFRGNDEMIFAGALMGGISMANTVAIFAHHYGYPHRGAASMITTNVFSVFTLSAIFLIHQWLAH
ncbi:MAG: AEC family transporter [Brachymonas sp.]|nr:AEC family transporter [Brachymonas sp.]